MTGFAFAYAVMRACGGQPRKNPGAPPFWYVDYTYQDTHYEFVMDGGGRLQELEAPKNEEEIAIVEENEKSKSGGLWVIVLLLWALSIVLGWIYSSWLVFFGLAILGFIVAGWAVNKDEKVDNLNKEVRNENMKRRQEMAQGFLGNWSEDKESQLGRNKDDEIRETKTTGNDDYLDSIV